MPLDWWYVNHLWFTCMHCTRTCSLVLNKQEILSMENRAYSKWAHVVNIF